MSDIVYSLATEVPIDLTYPTIVSGHHANLGKKLVVEEGEVVYWFYGLVCLGAASIELVLPRTKTTLQIWAGPVRNLTRKERLEIKLPGGAGSARGGAYAREVAKR